jgi:hypothetical protein
MSAAAPLPAFSADMSFRQIAEKSVSALIVLGFLLATDPRQMFLCMIVLGQAHFFIAYYMQYKAGKVDAGYVRRYIAAALFIFGTYQAVPDFGIIKFEVLKDVTGLWFIIHMVGDEFFLLGRRARKSQVLAFLPAIMMFSWYNLAAPFGHPYAAYVTVVMAGFLISAAMQRKEEARPLTATDLYIHVLSLASITVAGMAAMGVKVPVESFLSFVIIFHYFNWYAFAFTRYATHPRRMQVFFYPAMACNLLAIGLYAVSVTLAPFSFIHSTFFAVDSFYQWTLLHLFVTLRQEDFQAIGLARKPLLHAPSAQALDY